ncbi:UNVERIFIED_CONTAM: hypothetical protein K2H54_024796 [Gekko kuhli]
MQLPNCLLTTLKPGAQKEEVLLTRLRSLEGALVRAAICTAGFLDRFECGTPCRPSILELFCINRSICCFVFLLLLLSACFSLGSLLLLTGATKGATSLILANAFPCQEENKNGTDLLRAECTIYANSLYFGN